MILSFKDYVSSLNESQSKNYNFLLTEDYILEDVNRHSTHISDLLFTDGKKGLQQALGGLLYIKKKLGISSNDITVKIDGCVHSDTLVVTKTGNKKICDLTNDDFVKCYDTLKNEYKFTDCTLPRSKRGVKKWVDVIFDNNEKITCTEDHPFLIKNNVYREAKDLKDCDIFEKNGTIKVIDVVYNYNKHIQWDLTTFCANYVIAVGDKEIVAHNSPAIVCGWLNNKFFVGSKSIFSKNPKINYTDEDIDNNHEKSGLNEKLHIALHYLKDVVPNNKIFQGDFLFDSSSLKIENIDGIQHYVWHPNTIKYAVEKDTPLGEKIGNSKLGIIFHTEYVSDGKDPKSIKLKGFGVKDDDLHKSKDVWFTDAYHKNMSNILPFNIQESKLIDNAVKRCQVLSNVISWNVLDISLIKQNIMTFVNTFIKNGQQKPNSKIMASLFYNYIKDKMNNDINSKRTEKGKETTRNRWENVLDICSDKKTFSALFECHELLNKIKIMIIHKLDSVKTSKTFLQKTDGSLKVTGNEGFVLTKTSASGTKLVDQLEFSNANFSDEYVRGWTKN